MVLTSFCLNATRNSFISELSLEGCGKKEGSRVSSEIKRIIEKTVSPQTGAFKFGMVPSLISICLPEDDEHPFTF